jgi:hypothetical protein
MTLASASIRGRGISASRIPCERLQKVLTVSRRPDCFTNSKYRCWLRKRLATGFELTRGGPAKEIEPSDAGEKKF